MYVPTFEDVVRASQTLQGVTHRTPVLTSQQLHERSQAEVFLKCENFQRIGAFKIRGAYNALANLSPSQKTQPIITVSSGNHAQGVALACDLLGMTAHIVMAEPVNPLKRAAVEQYGGIIYPAANRSEADALGVKLTEEKKGTFIHPFNDPQVIAGQGTVALELLEEQPDLDILLAPVGGGGLLSGTCLAVQGMQPQCQIYACEPAGALDAKRSVEENRIIPMDHPRTIAEGLRTSLGDLTLQILRDHLSGFFVVEEKEIVEAMQFVFERLKIIIEPSSAVALAPLLRHESILKDKRVGVIITGGNVDFSEFFGDVLCHNRQKRVV
jgi:threonine dehydratase